MTASGKILKVVLSRDRKLLAYTVGSPREMQSLWVTQLNTRGQSQLVPPAEGVNYWELTFSPEGDYVYYVAFVNHEERLYRVPTLGGAPKLLLREIDSAVTFSPDGKRMAFTRNSPDDAESYLLTANPDGSGERVLAARRRPEYFLTQEHGVRISWSPDGQTIACPAGNTELAAGPSMEVVGVSVKDGAQRPLMRRRLEEVSQAEWLGDGSGLILVAAERASSPQQVWHVSHPPGEVRRVTNDFSQYVEISVAGDAVAAVQSDLRANIWVGPSGDAARGRQLTDSRNNGTSGFRWAPDGRLLYCSYDTGQADVWSMNADGGDRKRLTEGEGFDGWPDVSPDGRHVVFVSDRGGKLNLWRMEIDGSNPVQLTAGGGETSPYFSPDGRWVYYVSNRTWGLSGPILKVPAAGGEPVTVVGGSAGAPVFTPAHNMFAYSYAGTNETPRPG